MNNLQRKKELEQQQLKFLANLLYYHKQYQLFYLYCMLFNMHLGAFIKCRSKKVKQKKKQKKHDSLIRYSFFRAQTAHSSEMNYNYKRRPCQ